MKLQFSLATLLVCLTVLAVVCAVAGPMKVDEYQNGRMTQILVRPATAGEITLRLVLCGAPAVATTLLVPWFIRCLKFRMTLNRRSRRTPPPLLGTKPPR